MSFDHPAGSIVRQRGVESAFVCPLCGTILVADRSSCPRCGGTVVVSITDADVYETIVPMCGSSCDRMRFRERPDEPNPDDPRPAAEVIDRIVDSVVGLASKVMSTGPRSR